LEKTKIIKEQDEKKGLIQYVKIERSADTKDVNGACIKTFTSTWLKDEISFEKASKESYSFQSALLPEGTRSSGHTTIIRYLDGIYEDGTKYGIKTLEFSDDSIFSVQYNCSSNHIASVHL
jgi:hypothetical protein